MTMTATDMLAKTKQQLSALGHERDCRSDAEREAYWKSYNAIQGRSSVLMNNPADIERSNASLKPLEIALAKERAAETDITKRIDEMPDWRIVPDRRERDQTWARTEELRASLTTLRDGAKWVDGTVMLPLPLREALTDVCAHCGRSALIWEGSIGSLEARIAELITKRTRLERQLAEAMETREPAPV